MGNYTIGKNVLVIEDELRDREVILDCLPEFTKVDSMESLRYVDFESFSDDYILRICGIMDLKGLVMADYNTIMSFDVFRKNMKCISKLYQKNQGNLIIVTKMPIAYLLAYFKMLDDDPDVNTLFINYYDELLDNLSHGYSDFVLHEHKNIYTITKPDFDDTTGTMLWQNRFKMLVEKICAPYNTDAEKKET